MYVRIDLFLLAATIFLSTSCLRKADLSGGGTEVSGTIEIQGILEGGEGQTVLLEEMGAREFIPVDTATCGKEGSFHMEFSAPGEAFYVLRYGESGYITLLLEPGESIDFRGTTESTDPYSVKGSKGSQLLRGLAAEHSKTLNALAEVTRMNRDLVASPEYTSLKPGLDHAFDSITNRFHTYSLDFIHRNPESLAILIALYNLYGQGLPVFQPELDLHVYRYVDSVLMLRYSDFEAVQLLHAQVSQVEQIREDQSMSRGPLKGEIAPDFVSSRPDGQKMALSDLQGNYVVLGFWAGWSHLSREENSFLKKANELYREHPFRILQVSMDDDREIWQTAIREDALEWDHVSDLKRWETVVADLYQLDRIPSNVLIDPDGRILEKDLFGERLLEELQTIFSN
jgi:peroxiredoxin